MIKLKKRSLNEIRQTKDAHYVAPISNNKKASDQLFESYFSSFNNTEINASNYVQFLSFLNKRGYQITKK